MRLPLRYGSAAWRLIVPVTLNRMVSFSGVALARVIALRKLVTAGLRSTTSPRLLTVIAAGTRRSSSASRASRGRAGALWMVRGGRANSVRTQERAGMASLLRGFGRRFHKRGTGGRLTG